jgi:son of sevenless
MGQTGMESASIKILNLVTKKTKEHLILKQEEESTYILFFKDEVSSILMNYSEEEIAKGLTLISSKLFQKVKPNEFLNKHWMDEEEKFEKAKNLIKIINRSNLVGNWVTSEIIKPNLEDRKNAIMKCIKIAKIVKDFQNYNLLVEILSGLGSNPIYRLKKTWDEIPEEYMNIYNELLELINPKGSYKNLRNEIKLHSPPTIPYIGMFLTDLLFIEDGNPDIKGELINWSKRKLQAEIIRSIQMYQQMGYERVIQDFDDPDFENILTELEKKCENMDTLYDLSLKYEPRQKITL